MRSELPYAVTLTGPVLALLAHGTDTHLGYAAAGMIGGFLALDLLLGDGPKAQAHEEGHAGRWLPRLFAPALAGLTTLWADTFTGEALTGQVALLLAASMYTATFGINVAHELIHSRRRLDRRLGGLMLAVMWTGSFKVEHIRGHHRDVATPHDPSSAPLGRSLYAHIPHALWGNLAKGWRLETARIRRRGLPLHQHELLRWLAVSVLFTLGVGLLTGPLGALFVVLLGALSRLNLEIINYVEHYGLRRGQRADGGYVPVAPQHSWCSERLASRLVLLNLTRHADHHAHIARPFTTLRHHPDGPTLPAGYLAMFFIALVPPLWFAVMNPRVRALTITTAET